MRRAALAAAGVLTINAGLMVSLAPPDRAAGGQDTVTQLKSPNASATIVYSQQVALVAQVQTAVGSLPVTEGTVTFTDNLGTTLATGAPSTSVPYWVSTHTNVTAPLEIGPRKILAAYSDAPATTYNPSQSDVSVTDWPYTITVGPADSQITLTSTPLSGGRTTSLQAYVTPSGLARATPSGTVTFYVNGSAIKSVHTDAGGQATITAGVPPGHDVLSDAFVDDTTNFNGSTLSATNDGRAPIANPISNADCRSDLHAIAACDGDGNADSEGCAHIRRFDITLRNNSPYRRTNTAATIGRLCARAPLRARDHRNRAARHRGPLAGAAIDPARVRRGVGGRGHRGRRLEAAGCHRRLGHGGHHSSGPARTPALASGTRSAPSTAATLSSYGAKVRNARIAV